MAWRVARSLNVLKAQIDNLFPHRSTASDGSIGDAAHATRDSDHNPWVQHEGQGIVTARDFTHDPADGLDCHWLAKMLETSRDPRIKYVIWNRRMLRAYDKPGIPAWTWSAYSGTNPHTAHLHLSVSETPSLFDSGAFWRLYIPDTTVSALAIRWAAEGHPLSGRYAIDARQFMAFSVAIGAIPAATTYQAWLNDPRRGELVRYAIYMVHLKGKLPFRTLGEARFNSATAEIMRRMGGWTVTDVFSNTPYPS
jgi:hypothetical protein